MQCCGSGMFIPDLNFSIPDPESASKNLSIFNPNNFYGTKLSEMWFGMLIPDYFPSRIRIPGSQNHRILDPDIATLQNGTKQTTTKLTSGPHEPRMNKLDKDGQTGMKLSVFESHFHRSINFPIKQLNMRIVALPRSVSSPSTWIVLGRGFIPPADRGLAKEILLVLLALWKEPCPERIRTYD